MKERTDRDRLLVGASLVIAALATIASLGGLLTDVYRDNTWARSGFQGNDLVTVAVVVPLLVGALVAQRCGSMAGRLIWLGTIAYMLFNYAFYLFGATFNELFLAYVALVSLSGLVLVFGLAHTDPDAVKAAVGPLRSVRWIAAFLIGLPSLLGVMWIGMVVAAMVDGSTPKAVTDSGIHTAVVFALDLGLLLPTSLLAGIWLWQRRAWGYVLAAVLLVKDVTYALALVAMSFYAARAEVPDAWALAPLWVTLGILAALAAGALYRPLLRRTSRNRSQGDAHRSRVLPTRYSSSTTVKV